MMIFLIENIENENFFGAPGVLKSFFAECGSVFPLVNVNDAHPGRVPRQIKNGVDVEFFHNVVPVVSDGLFADAQMGCDVPGGHAFGNGLAPGLGLIPHVNHVGLSLGIEMGQFTHSLYLIQLGVPI